MVIVTRYALVLAVLMLFALPGAAQASTASVDLVDVTPEGDHSDRNYEAHVQYTADAGEVNQATLSFAAGSVTVKDTGAAISVSDGCRLVDKHTAVCRTTQRDAPLTGASAELGDGADRARLTSSRPFSWHVSGGAGDDLIDGSRVRYGMEAGGNTGEDTLIGGPGQDNLAGNDGADTCSVAPATTRSPATAWTVLPLRSGRHRICSTAARVETRRTTATAGRPSSSTWRAASADRAERTTGSWEWKTSSVAGRVMC